MAKISYYEFFNIDPTKSIPENFAKAVYEKNQSLVEFMIDRGMAYWHCNDENIISEAVKTNDAKWVKYIFSMMSSMERKQGWFIWNAIKIAAKLGNIEILKILCCGDNLGNIPTEYCFLLRNVAISKNQLCVLQWLDVNGFSSNSDYIYDGSNWKSLEILCFFLQKNIVIGRASFEMIMIRGSFEVIDYVVTQVPNHLLTISDYNSMSPFYTLRTLCKKEAEDPYPLLVQIVGLQDYTSEHEIGYKAMLKRLWDIYPVLMFKILKEASPDIQCHFYDTCPELNPYKSLKHAVDIGDYDLFEKIMKNHHEKVAKKKRSVLIRIFAMRPAQVLKFFTSFLKYTKNVIWEDIPPLERENHRNDSRVIHICLQNRIPILFDNREAYEAAIRENFLPLTISMFHSGIKMRMVLPPQAHLGLHFQCPLSWFSYHGNLKGIEFFLANGCHLSRGNTAICFSKNEKIVKFWMSKGIFLEPHMGRMLWMAIKAKRPSVIRFLLNHGVNFFDRKFFDLICGTSRRSTKNIEKNLKILDLFFNDQPVLYSNFVKNIVKLIVKEADPMKTYEQKIVWYLRVKCGDEVDKLPQPPSKNYSIYQPWKKNSIK